MPAPHPDVQDATFGLGKDFPAPRGETFATAHRVNDWRQDNGVVDPGGYGPHLLEGPAEALSTNKLPFFSEQFFNGVRSFPSPGGGPPRIQFECGGRQMRSI